MSDIPEKKPAFIPIRESDAKNLLPYYLDMQKGIKKKMIDLQIEESYNHQFIIQLRKLLKPEDGGYSTNWSWEEKCEFILKTSEKSRLTSRQISERINEYEPNYELNSIISSVSATLSVKSNHENGFFTFIKTEENGIATYALRKDDIVIKRVATIKI